MNVVRLPHRLEGGVPVPAAFGEHVRLREFEWGRCAIGRRQTLAVRPVQRSVSPFLTNVASTAK